MNINNLILIKMKHKKFNEEDKNRCWKRFQHIIKCVRILIALKHRGLMPKFLNEHERIKISIIEVRASFKFFGHDMDQWSDKEFIEGVKEAGKTLLRSGFTSKEMEEVAMYISEKLKS